MLQRHLVSLHPTALLIINAFAQSVVLHFDDLADLRGDDQDSKRRKAAYFDVVLAAVFAALGQSRTNHISWKVCALPRYSCHHA